MIPFTKVCTALILSSLLAGCVIHVGSHQDKGDISGVFGSISVDPHSEAGNVSAVNGGVTLEDDSSARDVSTVNGGIELGERVSIDRAETVNGGIEARSQLSVRSDLITVNGDIQTATGADIGGEVETVNGDIRLQDAVVGRDVKTGNGDIHLLGNTLVKGDVIFTHEHNNNRFWSWGDNDTPTLYVSANTRIEGQIILRRPVKLELDDSALNNKVVRRYGE
ncbi:hypothetical protein P2G88_10375 [Aliiglaciecola sp. CAU 1673]|uniref:hypothetical protein n=1 Tax=Aliiglaciecola sp. CAU 1673 TaxID=3032595 RepID=UPI0023DAF531|nr:hypothetical protein [Aliiglaciecola sp. CAU 1673]MDF2178654.1 hypothetical protein [Aliiglaciecola sp. CAU 1673]